MASGPPDDDAVSATLPSEPPEAGATSPAQIGRYQLQRRIGAGGMGVVHAAFDPDLERKVALKLLQRSGSDTSRQRLLREARALARLTHPNVPAVYEVGSTGGQDFIAMELVDGEPLNEWLRGRPRSEREIIDAFSDAGSGLAAAHAAGVVHRDFKPHNVLRSKGGRIVVVDFGLAREATDPLGVSKPASRDTPTELTGITVPGSLLGTPAYMAPEQWKGEQVTPATDQFSFCVALWEALAGERPYRAPTGEGLREQVIRGEPDGDVTKLPRRLRPILRRGLARRPADRWPSMNALLAQLKRRRPAGVIAAGVAAAGLVAGGLAFVLHTPAAAPGGPGCAPPAVDPAPISTAAASLRASGNAIAAWHLEHDLAQWRLARVAACVEPVSSRARRLACLDHVLERADAVRQAAALDPGTPGRELAQELIDPRACLRDDPPQLPDHYSDSAVRALAVRAGSPKIAPAPLEHDPDPCVQSYLALARSTPADAQRALHTAGLCGDDDAFAEASLASIDVAAPGYADVIDDAEEAVARAGQPRLVARLHTLYARYLFLVEDDLSVVADELAIANEWQPDAFGHLDLERQRLTDLVIGAHPEDLATVRREVAAWRPLAVFAGREVDHLDWLDAMARWFAGDVAGTHARLVELYRKAGAPLSGGKHVTGRVVDGKGLPVAGALVAASAGVNWDAAGVNPGLVAESPSLAELVETGQGGEFALDHVPDGGFIVAEHGAERSRVTPASPTLELKLEPTVRLTGHVRGVFPEDGVVVSARGDEAGFAEVAPILPDGSFELGGLRPGRLYITASTNGTRDYGTSEVLAAVDVPPGGIHDFSADLRPVRRVDVIVRSASVTPLEYAVVVVASGTAPITKLRDLWAIHRGAWALLTARPTEHGASQETLARMQADDTLAAFPGAPAGPAVVCAFGVPVAKGADAALVRERIANSYTIAPMHCQPLPADAHTAIVTVPPI